MGWPVYAKQDFDDPDVIARFNIPKPNVSKGTVYFHKRRQMYHARKWNPRSKRYKNIGYFPTEQQARDALERYNRASELDEAAKNPEMWAYRARQSHMRIVEKYE